MVGKAVAVVLASAVLVGQQKPSTPTSAKGVEFPVTLQQKVVAGQTAVGSKVEAKLTLATLVKGVVIPEGAILSGEITESAAKSANNPSRLTIRMDSARWKNGSTPIRVYLTAWYYPLVMQRQDSSDAWDASQSPTLRKNKPFPGSQKPSASSSPSPSGDADATPQITSGLSQHRVLMKNVESTCGRDGAVILTSQQSNLKLDKQTTYVLAGDCFLQPAK